MEGQDQDKLILQLIWKVFLKKKIGKIEHPRAVAQCQIINIHIIEISEEEQGKKEKKKQLKDMMTKNFPE